MSNTTANAPSPVLTISSSLPQRPVVIIAGWLGCRPKSLRRYISLYRSLGCDVIIRIPSPSMVILATTSSHHSTESRLPSPRGNADSKHRATSNQSVFDLAINTIEDVRKSSCNEFYIHVFSNGGCFLWEAIYETLLRQQQDTNKHNYCNSDDTNMISKLKGVIYDSAPADFSGERNNLIFHALEYCSPSERLRFKVQFMFERLFDIGNNKNMGKKEQRQQRAIEYWYKMRNTSLFYVPSLYILSKNDSLAPYKQLKELIDYRRATFGDDLVKHLVYENSPHCSHLRSNTQLYSKAIEEFLDTSSSTRSSSGLNKAKGRSLNHIPPSRL